MALICDTGPILAAMDRADPDHVACASLLATTDEDLIVPGLILAELDYWCRKIRIERAWLVFLEDVEMGAWRIEWPTGSDLHRARQLQESYRTLETGLVDASIIALVERWGEPKVATLDTRHFAAVRPLHVPGLIVVPS